MVHIKLANVILYSLTCWQAANGSEQDVFDSFLNFYTTIPLKYSEVSKLLTAT